jgi:hypothetical protein
MDEKPLTPKEAIEKARALRDQTDKPAVVLWKRGRLGESEDKRATGRLKVLSAYDEKPEGYKVVYWVSRDNSERPMNQWAKKMPSLEEKADVPVG